MIVEKLYEGEAGPRSPLQPGVLRMSMSESCTRRAAYEFLGYKPELDEDDDRRAIVMQDGNLHEQDIVRRLLLKGFNIWNFGEGQAWVSLTLDNLFWRGHPDLYIEIGGKYYGLDVKAFRDEVFKKETSLAQEILPGRFVISDPMILADGPFPIMGQMQMYLHTEQAARLGIEEWIVVIKNKNTSELAECFIPKMPDYVEYVNSRWKSFWALVGVERLPERNFEKNSVQCKMCSFRVRCWGPLKDLEKERISLDAPSLVEMAQYWREGKVFEKKAATRIELAKLKFENTAISLGKNNLIIDELDIRVNNRERTGLDTHYVSGLLDRFLRDGHITREEYLQCWDTTEYTEVRITDRRKKEDT